MNHEYFMTLALEEAKKAYNKNEVPIGAIIVKDGQVIARAHNTREVDNLATSHAEILAIQRANQKLQSWRLDTCSLYVTIEPCPMCSGAIIQSRIANVYYGARDPKNGSHQSITSLFDLPYNHMVHVEYGILEEECKSIMTTFFKELREKK
jgi:tRNA(adenine34) deaminase